MLLIMGKIVTLKETEIVVILFLLLIHFLFNSQILMGKTYSNAFLTIALRHE